MHRIWGKDTEGLTRFFIESGFKAIVCMTDPKKLDLSFCGSEYNEEFLSEIPENVDPCDEKASSTRFVYDGPLFKTKIEIKVLGTLKRNGFCLAEIVPAKFQEV
jgi:diphthamide synthase (EF-2-diphthine--ammonia ligase)